MSNFSKKELEYLQGERRLGRVATVGKDGTPHVTPVGWSLDADTDAIEVGGSDFANTKKFHDVERNGRAAIVIDDWDPLTESVRAITDHSARISWRCCFPPEPSMECA